MKKLLSSPRALLTEGLQDDIGSKRRGEPLV